MKRAGILFVVLSIIAAVFMFVNKSYYPSLPIDDITAKEAIDKLKKSDEKIVEIATDNNSIWYLTSNKNEGDSPPYENMKIMISSKGWEFKDQMGSGFFFEKDDEELIVTTQMWTRKYVIVQVPKEFK